MNNFRLFEEKQRFAREEAAELERKLAPIKAQTAAALAEHERAAAKYWSQSVSSLALALQTNEPVAYLGVAFSTTPTPQLEQGSETFTEACKAIQSRTGYILGPVGRQRVALMAVHQCHTQCASLTDIETYISCFNKLLEWGAFETSGTLEVGYDENVKAYVPEPEPAKLTIDDLETIDTSTREGEALGKRLVNDAVFGEEAKTIFHQFLAHVERTFGHALSVGEQNEIILFFQRRNLSWLDGASYDAARRHLVSIGMLNRHCLTEDERLCQEIEEDNSTDFQGTTSLRQKVLAARRRP